MGRELRGKAMRAVFASLTCLPVSIFSCNVDQHKENLFYCCRMTELLQYALPGRVKSLYETCRDTESLKIRVLLLMFIKEQNI